MEKVKYNTFAVMFYINKGRIKKDGTTTIMGRISVSGEMVQFSTKIDIAPTLWDAKAYRLKGREREAIEINNRLQELTDTIALYHKDFIKQQGYVTAELLKNRVCNIGQKIDMLLELFKEHNEDYKQMIGVNREEKSFITYRLAINHIADFVKVQYGADDIELIKLNLRFLEDMMLFLRGEKGLSINTANGIAISLKRVIKRAINQGTLRKDPFVGYKFDVVPPECRHQIEEDLHKLMTTEIKSKALCFSRDMFIFSTFTGTSFSDIVKLTDKNIGTNNRGDKYLTFSRQKTGTECYVPLLDIPMKIIEKYRSERKSERLFNMTTWSTMYENLGKMQQLCGLKEPISYHQSRHNFGTLITLLNDVPIETVAKMMGHKDLKTTEIYARMSNKKVGDDMKRIAGKCKSKFKVFEDKDMPIVEDYNYFEFRDRYEKRYGNNQ
ncbi:site-specific integrase [Bacteroides fragilis]|nr:site-specific integrase [Bacteroides fragilis]MCE9334469.1 site-specific integrase [Bacteroides fragilis]MCS2489609.1 site-specific integrase [Bacteroides fragilis]UVQ86118.1 site-specific integrase [Bacteroides fragilis]